MILDGYLAGANADGLTFKAAGMTLAGLVVQHFADSGVHVEAPNAVLFSDRLLNNVLNGVFIDHAPNAVIAGVNTVSGNANNGVEILASPNTILYGSRISGNGLDGVFVQDSVGVKVGSPKGAGNVIEANHSVGVQIFNSTGGSAVLSDLVAGNFIGTDPNGATGQGNLQGGLFVNDAAGILIGGTVAGGGNIVSGNQASGITISGPAARFDTIVGNIIGLTPNGTAASATRRPVSSSMDRPTSSSAERRRLIATSFPATAPPGFNSSARERLETSLNGNFIGTDSTGEKSVPNSLGGVVLDNASGDAISAPGSRRRQRDLRQRFGRRSNSRSGSLGNLYSKQHHRPRRDRDEGPPQHRRRRVPQLRRRQLGRRTGDRAR